ncbi:MAG: DUF4157 domain-containing protein [Leptolyngbyaceae cyanobacterium CSU_1_4]|nr:DUF4157 domain-containing protein [Leptolyngbyaceae cyanobacterium CSU_1_4]
MGRDRQNQAPSVYTPATATPQLFQTRPFAPQIQPDLENDQQTLELQEQGENGKKFSLSKVSLFPASANLPPPPSNQNRLQAKLNMGQPGDPYEQEADRMASQVVQRMNLLSSRSPKSDLQRQVVKEDEDEDESIQLKPMAQRSDEGAVSAELESSIQSAKGSGLSLNDSIRQPMEEAFGADFSGVKIHTDAQSDQLNRSIQAKAFTTGQDVFFRQGAYDPGSQSGQELLAHELTHVVQQGGATIQRRSSHSLTAQSPPQISRSPVNTIQRLLWHSDQFNNDIASKVTKTFSTPVVSTLSKQILFHLQAYENQFLNAQGDRSTPTFLENRSKAIKAIVALVPAARNAAETDEIREVFTQFEESLLGELKGVEAQKNGEQGGGAAEDVTETYFEYIYTQSVYDPIFLAICKKLGLDRGEWRRSDKLNAFRDSLKQAARTQAYGDIDTLIDSELQANQKDSTEASQSFYGQKAKVEAYTTAKVDVVNEVVKDLAHEITRAYIPRGLVFEEFRAALNEVRTQPLEKQKTAIKDKAATVVKEYAGKTSGKSASTAIATAREIAKGSSADAVADRETLVNQVTQVAKDKGIGKKAIQKVVTEDTLEKGFKRTAALIDLAVPTPGTSCEVDIQIKVPISHGVYFVTQVVGSAEKDAEDDDTGKSKQEVQAELEVTLGAGWSALGIDANAQVGFFFSSTAENSQKAIGLVSYGFYRKLQGVSPKAAAKVWGSGGEKLANIPDRNGRTVTADEGQANLAESWGAMMEEWLFYERDASGKIVYETDPATNRKTPKLNEDASVQVGAMAKGGAKVKTGIGDVEAKAQFRAGTEFSAETIGADALGKVKKSQDQLNKAIAGQAKRTAKIATSVDLEAMNEAFGCGLEVSLTWLPNPPNIPPLGFTDRIVELEVEGTGKVSTKLGGKSADWQKMVVSFGTSVGSVIKTLYERAKSQEPSNREQQGAKASIVGDATYALLDCSGEAGESLGGQLVSAFGERDDDFSGEAEEIVEVKQALELGITYGQERGKPAEPWERSIAIALKRVREMGFDADVVAAKMESKNRLGQYTKKWGG